MTIVTSTSEPKQGSLARLLDLEQTGHVLRSLSAVTGVGLRLTDAHGATLLVAGEPECDDSARSIQVPVSDPLDGEIFGALCISASRESRVLELARLMAVSLGQIAAHERDARRRMAELTTLYNTSMMLAESRDLSTLLTRTVRLVSEVMGVKGASIRLIDEERDELRFVAVHGLSQAYLASAPLRLSRAVIDLEAIRKGAEQVADLRGDSRVQFPHILDAEGIVSILSVPLRYKGQAIGVLRAYTSQPRHFEDEEVQLVQAVASQAAAAIANARLAEESAQAEALERQVMVAVDVQQRMIPTHPPSTGLLEVAHAYIPCYELAGDLYDFIELGPKRLAVVIADVAGKGVPASLIMATVRAYVRASSEHLSEPCEIVGRLNRRLCTDNRAGEFVSLLYGVFDMQQQTLEFVRAGHIPPLLVRDGHAAPVTSGGDVVLGILPEATFTSHTLELRAGDRLLLYTDGLDEARNFKDELYGSERVRQSLLQPAETAEMIVQNLIWDMRRFVGLQRRTDDVTVIAVRVLGE